MFNNIKWKESWTIEEKYSEDKNKVELWLQLICGHKCDILLHKGSGSVDLSQFYDLPKESFIQELTVIPNELLYLIAYEKDGTVNKKKFQVEVSKLFTGFTQYRIIICPFDLNDDLAEDDKRVYFLTKFDLEERMKGIVDYIEIFPFSLPLGKCFGVEQGE